MNEKQEKALQEFLLDIDCLRQLDPWTDNFNIFDVLKITHAEIRHSNILGWLLDPNENHKMGDSFLRAFIANIVKKMENQQGNSLDLLMQDLYTYSVLRESNHMDLILLSREEKTAYIIENKIWAGESQHQLRDYYNKSREEYKGYTLIYAFLTPKGHDASDSKTWISISYEEIIPLLEKTLEDSKVSNQVQVLVSNYIRAVRENIMGIKDERLINICNSIYNKHRDALKLIFENVNVDRSVESEIISSVLSDMSNEGKIIYKNDNSWRFLTKRMNDYLPELDSDEGSWGTSCTYYYWLEKPGDSLVIHLEVGGRSVSDESLEKMKLLMKVSKEIGNRVNSSIPFVYKRLYTKVQNIKNDNDYEESIEMQARKLIEMALENEDKLFDILNKQQ